MRSLKPVASEASNTAPMIAVPSEEPRFWAVPCRPPASLDCVGATADMITFPSCEASSPAPAPISASASLKPVSLRVTSSVGEHHRGADADRDQPDLRDRARRAPLGHARAEEREHEHRHRQRQQALAGLERIEAEHDLQVDGDHEERAHQDELLADERREPGAQLRRCAAARCRAAGRGRAGRAALPRRRTPTAARGRRAP